VSKADFEQLILESHHKFLSQMADRELAAKYDVDSHVDLPIMLTKTKGLNDWMVNKYVFRYYI